MKHNLLFAGKCKLGFFMFIVIFCDTSIMFGFCHDYLVEINKIEHDCFLIHLSLHDYTCGQLAGHLKGEHSLSIEHCPHLWNPPLQPIHHSQQSYCL